MPQKKDQSLSTSLFNRGLSLARASIRAGRFAAGGGLANIEVLVQELGRLKGSAMKVGQTLSLYGESLFPKEVNDLLKNLQAQAQPLSWPAMERQLLNELGPERVDELDIDETSLASASIGQVYKAKIRATGEIIALKIQYPGVEEAIDSDMKLLKVILALPGIFPGGLRLEHLLAEIREMFMQEIDYTFEIRYVDKFREWLAGDGRYLVPKTYPRYSTRRVLATEFMSGVRADDPQVQSLPLERRNQLGEAYFDLYLRELLDFKVVQTDPHLGNYLVEVGSSEDKLILFDFGAMREAPDEFLSHYQNLMMGGVTREARLVEKGGRGLGLLKPEDSLQLVEDYVKLCYQLCEPFHVEGAYDWGASDLPKRVAEQVKHVAFSYKLRAPPREIVFLDRKLGGVFMFLSVLKCKWAGRELVLSSLKKFRGLESN